MKSAIQSGRLHDLLALALILVVALLLRLFRLADANIWWDEGLAVWAVRQDVPHILEWTARDVHPPLYFLLLHGWRMVAGDSEFAVRLPSAVLGALTVAGVWQLARTLMPGHRWLALTAAALLAVNPFLVWWSQEARMYMLGGLLCVAHLVFTVRLGRGFHWGTAVGYVLTGVAALWTLYLLAFVLVVDGLYWLWTLRDRPRWRSRLSALGQRAILQAIVVAGVVPWLAYTLPRMQSWSVQEPFDAWRFAELYATLLVTGVTTHLDAVRPQVLGVLSLVLVGLVAAVVARHRRGERMDAIVLALLMLLVPALVVWLVATVPRSVGYAPKVEARYLLPFAALFAVLVAASIDGFATLGRRIGVVTGIGVFVGVMAVQVVSLRAYYAARYLSDDYRSIALTLRAHAQPGDRVVLHTDQPWPVFAYHWAPGFRGVPHAQAPSATAVEHLLQPIWEQHEAVWLVINEDALRADPDRLYEQWLASRASASQAWRMGTKRLVLYARTPERAATLTAVVQGALAAATPARDVYFAQGVMGWEQPLARVRAGDTLYVAAYLSTPTAAGQVEVGVGNYAGARGAVEVPRSAELHRVLIPVPIPHSTPAGTHALRITLVGWDSHHAGSVEIVPGVSSGVPSESAAEPTMPISGQFGDPPLITLRGYDLDGPRRADTALTVTLHWHAGGPSPLPYKVFVQLLDQDGRLAAQRDDFPVQGQRPTTGWQAGEVILDRYTIHLPASLPTGTYTLQVGFYDPVTGERFTPVHTAGGDVDPDARLILGDVRLGATPSAAGR